MDSFTLTDLCRNSFIIIRCEYHWFSILESEHGEKKSQLYAKGKIKPWQYASLLKSNLEREKLEEEEERNGGKDSIATLFYVVKN